MHVPVEQLSPAGLEETEPVPETYTTRGYVNRAETDLAELIVIVQVLLVPVHAPVQPVKVAPECGEAVSVTVVPAS